MRVLSPVEAAALVSLGGSVLAVGVPAFVRNLHASRLVEPVDGLNRIAARATALAATQPAALAYPETVLRTPSEIPRGRPVTDPQGTWDAPTWRLLDFSFTVPHSYSFTFESRNAPEQAVFRAVAEGDLDGDGNPSTFEVRGEARDGKEPVTFPMESRREVE